jgi:hypothetical protein
MNNSFYHYYNEKGGHVIHEIPDCTKCKWEHCGAFLDYFHISICAPPHNPIRIRFRDYDTIPKWCRENFHCTIVEKILIEL